MQAAPRFHKVLALTLALAAGFASPALAQDSDKHLGVTIWGLSYHINRDKEFDEANFGLGLRYYFNRFIFVEADALHNSNGGLVTPVSVGLDLKFASIRQCNLYAVAAGTVAFYQNPRTDRDYFKFGPVPGVTLGCGRVKVNGIIVLQPESQPFSVIAASLTLMLH